MIKEKDLQTDEKPDCKSFMVSGPSSSLRSMCPVTFFRLRIVS